LAVCRNALAAGGRRTGKRALWSIDGRLVVEEENAPRPKDERERSGKRREPNDVHLPKHRELSHCRRHGSRNQCEGRGNGRAFGRLPCTEAQSGILPKTSSSQPCCAPPITSFRAPASKRG